MTEDTLMTADTLTKDESIRLMQAEIERLRYDLGLERHSNERLRKSLNDHLESEAAETRRADRERDRARTAEAEIERLREIIRDLGTCVDWYVVSNSMKQRIREALGE